MMKKILFLVNPLSGKGAGRKIHDCIVSELQGQGLIAAENYDIEFTEADIAGQLKEVVSSYETVAVGGGDGTISRVLQVISGLDRQPKVGIIPIGIGNDLARSLGILEDYKTQGLKGLLGIILNGKTRQVDLVGLNDKGCFVNYFGIGIDAKISNDFNRLRSKPIFRRLCGSVLNKAFYGLLALKNIFYAIPFDIQLKYYKPSGPVSITVPGGICQVLITNVKTYAGGAIPYSKSRMDDSEFEITVVRSLRHWLMIHYSRFSKKPLDLQWPCYAPFQTDRLEITFSGNACCQVDGETFNDRSAGEKHLVLWAKTKVEVIVS